MRTINILCCRLIAEIPVQAAFLWGSKQAIVNIFGYRWKSYQLITFTTQFLTHLLIANCRFLQANIRPIDLLFENTLNRIYYYHQVRSREKYPKMKKIFATSEQQFPRKLDLLPTMWQHVVYPWLMDRFCHPQPLPLPLAVWQHHFCVMCPVFCILACHCTLSLF